MANPPWLTAVHVLYPLALILAGQWWAGRTFAKRLVG